MAPLDAREESKDGEDPYLEAWASISRSMEAGVSWSGHERNVAWLNAGDGTFVEASGPLGFDQIEDGRVVCKTDWDRDGDVDLWLRSRNGVTLRYLENQSNPVSFLEVSDLGTRTSLKADLVAAQSGVADIMDFEPRMFAVPLTDGYLSAPSRRLTVALPDGIPPGLGLGSVDGVGVPYTFTGPQKKRLKFVGQDLVDQSDSFDERPPLEGAGALDEVALPTRTVLRSGLPFPTSRLDELGVRHEREPRLPVARLLVVRSAECPTCESVLPGALSALEGGPGGAPVEVVEIQVSLDLESQNGDHTAAAAALRTIVASVLGPGAELALPLSVLLDAQGTAHVIYQADLDASIVSQDANDFVLDPVQGALRASWGASGAGSRWFHGSPRSIASLRSSLEAQGLQEDADFFAAMAARKR